MDDVDLESLVGPTTYRNPISGKDGDDVGVFSEGRLGVGVGWHEENDAYGFDSPDIRTRIGALRGSI